MSASQIYQWNNTVILGRGLGHTIVDFALSPLYALKNPKFIEPQVKGYKPLTGQQASDKSYLCKLILIQRRLFDNPYGFAAALRYYSLSEKTISVLNSLLKSHPFGVGGALLKQLWHAPFIKKPLHQISLLNKNLPPLVKKTALFALILIGILGPIYLALISQNIVYSSFPLLITTAHKLVTLTIRTGAFLSLSMGVAAYVRYTQWYGGDLQEIERARQNHLIGTQKIQQIVQDVNISKFGQNPELPLGIAQLPLDVLVKIFSLLDDQRNLQLTAKWMLKLCHHERPRWEEEKFKTHLHPNLLELLEQKLGSHAYDQFQKLAVSDTVATPALKEPLNAFLAKKHLQPIYTPGSNIEWMFPEKYYTQCLSYHPPGWPLMQSDSFRPAPFPLTKVLNLMDRPSAAYAWTPAGTLALYFPYRITFFDSFHDQSTKTIMTRPGVFMLTQASPFDNQNWLLVNLSFRESKIFNFDPEIYERGLEDSYPYTRLFVYDDTDQLDPDCQPGVAWFTKFLEGQPVGWFRDRQEGSLDPSVPGGCLIKLDHQVLEDQKKIALNNDEGKMGTESS